MTAVAPVPLWRAALVVAATAVTYVATGALSVSLRSPQDFALIVFFPAGVAAAAALTQGRTACAGVFLGALVFNAVYHHMIGHPWWDVGVVLTAATATLMATATAWAVRRWVGYPNALDTPGPVARLLFGVLPLSSMLNSSLSVPVLVARGVIAVDAAADEWLGWWLGDALGTLLVVPLALLLLGEPRAAWRARRFGVGLPLLMGLVVVAATVRVAIDAQEQQMALRLDQISEQAARALQRRLDAQIDAVQALGQVMAREPRMSQPDFEQVTDVWLRRYPGTQNFTYNWRVPADERTQYECCEPGWPILGRDAQGQTFPALPAAQHIVITRLVPLDVNRSALGLDVLSYAPLRQTVERAIATGRPQATEPFRLVKETGEQRGVVVYHAVRAPRPPHDLLGVASSAFRMDDVSRTAWEGLPTDGLTLCVVDRHAPAGNARLTGPPGCDEPHSGTVPSGARTVWPLRFAQREWELRVWPQPAFWRAALPPSRLHALAVTGFVAVGLLGALLLVGAGQRQRIEALVRERTAELVRQQAELEHLAHHDPLTGLLNRTRWTQLVQGEAAQARDRGEMFAVILLDLDRFKRVNDGFGHERGDEVLRIIAQRLQQALRERDALARFGGDEFVALLRRVRGREGATLVARKFAAALDQPIEVQGQPLRLNASQGVVLFPDDGGSVEALLRHAHAAMYAAKEAGRNQWCFFDASMQAEAARRLALENALRAALDDPADGGLSLAYQPQLDASGTELRGLEALVRWYHPALGAIPPSEFIPLAEESGFIDRLGDWVLRTACAQLAAWRAGPLGARFAALTLAVNVSPIEFTRPGFVERVRAALALLGAETGPHGLELEVTEGLLLQTDDELIDTLNQLTALGVRLTLDDFGTGYSSLGYLKRLPITQLKIDRSFVAGVPNDPDDAAIVRATLSMAHDLGLSVVAEGVETAAQRDFLRRHECDAVQGWLYARALTPDDLLAWLREHQVPPTPG
ncbi:bifunctional diguanylate cyclase/phosphodiesterase [Tepidimonas charontis]|nr:EAL domain-containing protein [Tepidimonas charontis]